MKSFLKKITPFISILFFGLAVWFLEHELRQHDLGEVARQLSDLSVMNVAVSLILSFMSYLILTGYDGLGVKYIGEKLSPGRVIRAGFISYAFSHNIGLALITGGSIRYRIYSAWGFSGIQVTQIVAFSALTLWLGFCTVAGLSLIFSTPSLPQDMSVPFISLQTLGAILLLMVFGYLWGSSRINRVITFKGHSFSFPDIGIAVQQIVLASVDWLMAASVLYVLLPASAGINFFSFTGVFLLAMIIGLFSQVPGGLGVFESVMLVYLSNYISGATVLGLLLVYRVIYYILPLLVAMLLMGYQEYVTNRRVVKYFGYKAVNWFPQVVPYFLSALVFISGAMLLFTGALPVSMPRLQWLQTFLPIPVIEMSHFLASLIGAALLIVSRGLQQRIDIAYHLTVTLVIFGAILSFLRGADYIEASFLLLMLGILIVCRKEFYRKTSLLTQPFSTGWITVILVVIFSSIWLGIFSYRNAEYQNELWWHFTLLGDAPRYIRASVAVLTGTFLFGLIKLLKPKQVRPDRPKAHEYETAEFLVAQSNHAMSNLVLLHDKKLLFDNHNNAFIMYMTEGKSWVSMGDPVGHAGAVESLVWKYRELCDEYDVWPVFYQAREDYLDLYTDVGLTYLKLGEEARIPLQSFDPKSSVDRELYDNYCRVRESGYEFEVIPKQEVHRYQSRLKLISAEWLQQNGAHEKHFSSGRYSPGYLQNFPLILVKNKGQIVAFSNIWKGAEKYELSTDLLRFRSGTDEHLADYIQIETMLWGAHRGYEWFNLGMAPLSGMEGNEMTRGWNKIADLVFTYGENFYSFKKVREHKSQYQPVWNPKYLVCPGGLAIPGVISSLTTLISGEVLNLTSR